MCADFCEENHIISIIFINPLHECLSLVFCGNVSISNQYVKCALQTMSPKYAILMQQKNDNVQFNRIIGCDNTKACDTTEKHVPRRKFNKMHSIYSLSKWKIIYAAWFDSWSFLLDMAHWWAGCFFIGHTTPEPNWNVSYIHSICYFNIKAKKKEKKKVKDFSQSNHKTLCQVCVHIVVSFFIVFLRPLHSELCSSVCVFVCANKPKSKQYDVRIIYWCVIVQGCEHLFLLHNKPGTKSNYIFDCTSFFCWQERNAYFPMWFFCKPIWINFF